MKRFNKKLSSGRILVEQTIGAWKMRFPVIKNTCRIRAFNVSTIVLGTAILHNILNSLGVELPVVDFVEEGDEEGPSGVGMEWDGEHETESVRDVMVDFVATL